jgi:hypothetical protein
VLFEKFAALIAERNDELGAAGFNGAKNGRMAHGCAA